MGVKTFKNFFILILGAFNVISEEAFKVDSAAVQRLEALLKANSVATAHLDFNEMEKLDCKE